MDAHGQGPASRFGFVAGRTRHAHKVAAGVESPDRGKGAHRARAEVRGSGERVGVADGGGWDDEAWGRAVFLLAGFEVVKSALGGDEETTEPLVIKTR